MIDKKKKAQIIKKFATHESDTGSSEVQIALLTEEIKNLTGHLKTHKKDFSSRRGLLRKVSERRKLLKYLQRENSESFEELVKKLKLKTFKKTEEQKDILEAEIETLAEEETENIET
ncbi:MAG: 30S ribosomal protein S15 [Candidatus Buchananbacteria bacterium RIFCSPHIGHO2_02_FULL_40_13]|uniref:Small ribosomal subunit protein uS15 n=1 Tax=Candidatus Buchananbacteria bacterium RIFCSPLOWO2_01_FULL_39_33 TaxID=1797543 RepID=A0A1G1YIG7_9BACT|nr:MAG: 30S ribosomal protein S15 [Candidatus Buchananbacteria bacterium RIFCSPHIGHO2_02_FULL_40_13]OGY51267.1 MAG: 30S ribosomal protein S15 [Candidatus Buchananbacteria bacterium RIFCSPLOWO2_01_FULL_39_33]